MPRPKKRAKTRVPEEVLIQLEERAEEEQPAAKPQRIPDAYRCRGFAEVELGFSFPVACREASRCLHCDYVPLEQDED